VKRDIVVDVLNNPDIPEDIKKGYRAIEQQIDSLFFTQKAVPQVLKKGDEQVIENVIEKTPIKMSLSSFNRKKIAMGKLAQKNFANIMKNSSDPARSAAINGEVPRIVASMGDYLEDKVAEHGSKIDVNILGKFQDTKKKFADSLFIEKQLNRQLAKETSSAPSFIKDLMGFKGLLGSIVIGGAASGQALPGLAVAGGINLLVKSRKVPANAVNGMSALANHLNKNPDGDVARKIIVASGLGVDPFHDAVTEAVARVNLLSNPVQRTTQDVREKANSIVSLVRDELGDETADELHKAIRSGDSSVIGPIMDELSKQPGSEKFVSPRIVTGKQ